MKRAILAGLLLASYAGYAKGPVTGDSLSRKTVTVYTTAAKTTLRIAATDKLSFSPSKQPYETEVCIFVDPAKSFQTMTGIGGALTDAAAEVFAKLPKEKQAELLKAYFDPVNGIGYTLARTNIHSCDFSSESYTYIEEGDSALKTFSVKHDMTYRVPFIKAAIAAAGGKLTLFASPWSPPAFMKDNGSMLQGGKLLPRYYQAWANYYVKFIRTYESLGIPVWGLSVQNEPMAKQTWESCNFTAEEERDFIKRYLGPTLQRAGLSTKKLIAWDHNRDQIYQRASTILEDPAAAKYVWGIGYHWYETWTGSSMEFDNVRKVKEAFPDKNLIFTEGCVESFKLDKVNDWALGERYGTSILNDFNSGTVAWTDWNILLDEKGGPNHLGNLCFAPVHADSKTGELIYTNSYYYLGHFSKFIRPGAKRIIASSNRTDLQTTAFVNKDGKIVVVVLNTSDKELSYKLWIKGNAADVKSLPHSIETLVVN
ncbi:glycoside hydrolase family 30 protein [Chitinophaga sancti]|uniref:Glucosylceramidase n=1 Tax=Chitinophaga sancti TaxID=1004 RepID=A0A1K1SR05_9BACT|nr:glycoside hydrolase family 30 beta sandwich domain-containing protein [Chitinophaga sancti]WQD65331.1 glycoside hydrolase family 30 beta sandwich domain-containing protein [Chitinophaga sancti]WQG89045.1 glycoside hydrolase family 30 beta sandwich domain-containing protein [Chitinophaga sancti]SFW86848.1 glucosylceramidase [Chitinophaga sancti]